MYYFCLDGNIYQSKTSTKISTCNKKKRCLQGQILLEEIKGVSQCNIFNYPWADLGLGENSSRERARQRSLSYFN